MPENAATVRSQRGRRCQACLADLPDFKKGIASDEIEDLSKELKKEVSKPLPRYNHARVFSSTAECSSAPSRWKTSSA
jgi:hypothetical protein